MEQIESSKIKFDYHQLDENGLIGPEDGRVSITYEFCIPDLPANRAKVKKIDPTIVFTQSLGRSMCTSKEILCLGHTAQKNPKKVLERLAKLRFVEKISETYFE